MGFIVAGVDGSGKSTAVKHLKMVNCIDRHKEMDKLTFGDVEFPDELEGADDTVVLTANLDVLQERIAGRGEEVDLYETRRSLFYFDRKYKEIAAHYGIPVIDTTHLSPIGIAWAIRHNRRPDVPLKDMTAEYAEDNFELICEGESKKIYQDPLSNDHVYIVLKDTVYLHSMQSTGEISGLGALRAKSMRFFMDLMFRNEINHAYVAVNDSGVIYSRKMYNINPLEVVVKEFIEGTDKHSFYGYKDLYGSIDGRYSNGPYVRFDWRNPNHVDDEGKDMRESLPDYYVVEKQLGKEEFLKKYLTKPMGDKAINEAIVDNIVVGSCRALKKEALKLYFTIRYALSMAGIRIKDVCFMISEENDGLTFWSELNQDCMRVVTEGATESPMDKDIWRAGGSSTEERLYAKWNLFNEMVLKTTTRYKIDSPVWCYDYHPGMVEMIATYDKPVNEDIYVECVSNPGPFVVAGKSKYGFPDILLYDFDPDESMACYPHVVVNSIEDARLAIKGSARRVLIPSYYEHVAYINELGPSRVIIPVDGLCIDVIATLREYVDVAIVVGSPHMATKIMINFPSLKRFMRCDNIVDVHSAWGTGFVPIISPSIEDVVARDSFSKPTITVVHQNLDGIITSIDTDVRVKELNFKQDGSRHIIDKNTLVVVSTDVNLDDIGRTPIKSNILSLYESAVPSASAQIKLSHDVWSIDDEPEKIAWGFLNYLKYNEVDLVSVLNKMNAQRWDVTSDVPRSRVGTGRRIAITNSKYRSKTFNYIKEVMGIEICGPSDPKSLELDFKVVDEGKCPDWENITFIPCRPKDIPYLLTEGFVDSAVTYNTVMDRFKGDVFKVENARNDYDVKLCLICRKGEKNTVTKPYIIAAEHYSYVKELLPDSEVVVVHGSSESLIVNEMCGFNLCDAIVESGDTLVANNLEIFEILEDNVTIATYSI